jgi:hypothetical protein
MRGLGGREGDGCIIIQPLRVKTFIALLTFEGIWEGEGTGEVAADV